MVSFGEKAKIKRPEIWMKVVYMLLQLYYLLKKELIQESGLYGSFDIVPDVLTFIE